MTFEIENKKNETNSEILEKYNCSEWSEDEYSLEFEKEFEKMRLEYYLLIDRITVLESILNETHDIDYADYEHVFGTKDFANSWLEIMEQKNGNS